MGRADVKAKAHKRRRSCWSRTPTEPNTISQTTPVADSSQAELAPAGSPTTAFPSRQRGHLARSRAPDQVFLHAAVNTVGSTYNRS
jgi:hypothetical protein